MARGIDDKVALVTGGGSGIGEATALRLAGEGARVFIVGRRQERLTAVVDRIRAGGGSAEGCPVDLSTRTGGDDAVAAAAAWGGRLDILVNAAGTFPATPVDSLDDGDWEDALAINLGAVMRTSRAAARAMAKSGGTIVNVASVNAVMGDKVSVCSAYSAAKSGQLGLTMQFAAELAPAIRVNAILPGPVDTPMLEGWLDDPEERRTWLERFVPLNRVGHPEEIAGAVAFLVSDDGSYITGAILPVDGGMTVV
ncbi:MAG: SDR family NAD(P)-dependent oxidoreductase [bacterium]|nr:SDR family NAD(P)-dependent oxidoreductase [bacterium]